MHRGYSYQNIPANATTTIKSGAGILKRIVIGEVGSGDSLATVYDNTAGSGTKIASISLGAYAVTLEFDARFATGLTVVTTGTTPGKLTIVYE